MNEWPARFAFLLLVWLCAACAAPPEPMVDAGMEPALDSDEAGLWMRVERSEEALRTSGKVVDDPVLHAYVNGIVCRLSPEFCEDIRVYIVRQAGFNASMAPNGAMYVWTGLLLRVQNEAQLATVLGHELAHYQQRHSLARWRDIRAKTTGLIFFQLAVAVAGIPLAGDLAALGVYGSILAFSREHEREADDLGFEMMANAGYDPEEASKVWVLLIEEKEASDDEETFIFFSTHPASEERSKTLAEMAKAVDGGERLIARERFLKVTAHHRPTWMRDELRQRDYERIEVLIQRRLKRQDNKGELQFFLGELHRMRGEDDDDSKAVEAYETALQLGGAPPEAHRSLALTYWSLDRPEEARLAFENYLAADPEAEDRLMIESYIEQLR